LKQLIWFGKRLVPIVLGGGLIAGMVAGNQWLKKQEEAKQFELARTVAILWVGTATYRADPSGYATFRDSVIAASPFSKSEIEKLLASYAESPDRTLPLVSRINKLVDSISRIREGRSPINVELDSLGNVIE
jgi:hypothetical protein